MLRTLLGLFLWTGLAFTGSNPDYESAKTKIDLIVEEEAARGSMIRLSVAEVNALSAGEAAANAPDAIRNTRVVLGEGRLTWTGMVNFSKLAESDDISFQAALLLRMLKGERPVTIEASLQSGNGKATVEADSVRIGDTEMEGAMLDLMVEQLLSANFEDAEVGEPFELEHNVEQIRIAPDGIDVKIFP